MQTHPVKRLNDKTAIIFLFFRKTNRTSCIKSKSPSRIPPTTRQRVCAKGMFFSNLSYSGRNNAVNPKKEMQLYKIGRSILRLDTQEECLRLSVDDFLSAKVSTMQLLVTHSGQLFIKPGDQLLTFSAADLLFNRFFQHLKQQVFRLTDLS